MKKLGKSFSFLTKIMLVIGLLISNLSSLSVVFAYEVADSMVIDLVDDNLKISYTQELAENVESVNVKVYEKYTYLDGSSEEKVEESYFLTADELLAALEGNLELTYASMFAVEEVKDFKLFDGTYSAKVTLVASVPVEGEQLEEEEQPVVDNASDVEENTNETLETQELESNDESDVVYDEVVLAEKTFEKVITHKSGLKIRMFDANGVELTLVNGKFPVLVDSAEVEVVAQVLSGGLTPTDMFKYNDKTYTAYELLSEGFADDLDFNGRLFGEYEVPVKVELQKVLPEVESTVDEVVPTESNEEVVTVAPEEQTEVVPTEEVIEEENYETLVYSNSVKVMYESYDKNAVELNKVASEEGYSETYLFYGEDKDGELYVLSGFDVKAEETTETEESVVTRTMLDLYNMLNVAYGVSEGEEQIVTYSLLKNGVNVLESFVPASEEDTLEDYLATIELDDTVVVSLSNEGLTITYKVVVVGDLNNDKVLTEEDVLDLINQFVGESEVTNLEKSDLYKDDELNMLDVLYLNQIVKAKDWEASISESNAVVDASLNVVIDSETELVSGDEFTVEYVLSLTENEVSGFSGMLEYDKESLELVSVDALTDWVGNYSSETGKFLYLGEESLNIPEVELPETETPEGENNNEAVLTTNTDETLEPEVVTADYVVLTAKFKALKSGVHTVKVKDNEFVNDNTYLVLEEELAVSADVVVNASDDNTLSSLEVAGQKIALEDNKFEYEITVSNDVTLVDLKYTVSNIAANVTSAVFPEELVEGTNTVVITVTSESGVSQDYTITVIREEAVEEETPTYVDDHYSDDNNKDEEVVVTPGAEDDDEEETDKEESNLSRIIIIILILLVIAGLVYLIFKDEDEEETKKANKDVDRLKKESLDKEVKVTEVKTNNNKSTNKANSSKTTNKSNNNKKNNKKER